MSTILRRAETLIVTVNHDRAIVDGVKAGKYDRWNHNIDDSNFRSTGKGRVLTEIILTCFDRPVRPIQGLEVLDEHNLRPVDIQELLAIGEQHPEKQRNFQIFALGSIWYSRHDNSVVQYLGEVISQRVLELQWTGYVLGVSSRVAAVRKQVA